MQTLRNTFSELLAWVIAGLLVACIVCCVIPYLDTTIQDAHLWFATPRPTPIAVVLDFAPEDEVGARETVYAWLQAQQDLTALPTLDLETRAYYLAGEAPRLRQGDWPMWYGLRYAVGPASGAWLYYWPGCPPCPAGSACIALPNSPRPSLATFAYPGLSTAPEVGAALAWREEQAYIAVIWPGVCPPPAPEPTRPYVGPTGPGQ